MTKTEIKLKKGKDRPKLIVSREMWKRVNPKDRETMKLLYKIIHPRHKPKQEFEVIYRSSAKQMTNKLPKVVNKKTT